jgi:hypothetical protein
MLKLFIIKDQNMGSCRCLGKGLGVNTVC